MLSDGELAGVLAGELDLFYLKAGTAMILRLVAVLQLKCWEILRPVRMTHRPCEENASKKELFEAIYGLNSHISSRSHHCEALCL